MSFSEDIKSEILSKDIKKQCCLDAMSIGESLTVEKIVSEKDINSIINSKCCIKNLVKGAFLGSGYVTDPKVEYHMEITVSYKNNMIMLKNAFIKLGMGVRNIKRGRNYVIYLKDGENISKFLTIIEAFKAVIYFEEIRVEKELKNNINRIVNFETANLNKIISTSQKQIDSINYLKKIGRYNLLKDELKQIAQLRVKYPNESLEQLAKRCSNTLSKSGINHRLNKINEIANEEREKKK